MLVVGLNENQNSIILKFLLLIAMKPKMRTFLLPHSSNLYVQTFN